jgi:uncharacterized protein YbjQ (UPF0145 family)
MTDNPEATAGVPADGLKRLKQGKDGLFTSDLSVNEFMLVQDAGFEPLGLVMGSSIYHLGFQPPRAGGVELTTLSQAMYSARELAMSRLEAEAGTLGADGVIGVRLEVGRHDWGEDLAEFVAIGTAVRHTGGEPYRAVDGRPFTSDLSGQDFWTLLKAGHRPVGLVMGSCVYHAGHRGPLQTARQSGQNVEMTAFTQALYDARELAMARMQDEAERCQAAGIVGVRIQENHHKWGDHTVEFFAVGTAVVPLPAAPGIQSPTQVLSLDNLLLTKFQIWSYSQQHERCGTTAGRLGSAPGARRADPGRHLGPAAAARLQAGDHRRCRRRGRRRQGHHLPALEDARGAVLGDRAAGYHAAARPARRPAG